MNYLIRDCLRLDPDWRNGALYSMMMSVTNTRSDLSEQMHRDTLKHYFDKVVLLSDSMNAYSYVSYAESVHKKYQEKKAGPSPPRAPPLFPCISVVFLALCDWGGLSSRRAGCPQAGCSPGGCSTGCPPAGRSKSP